MMHSATVTAMSYAQQATSPSPQAPPTPPSTAELEQQVGAAIRAAQNAANDAARAQAQARGAEGQIIRVGPPGSPSIIVDGRGRGGGFGGGGFGGGRFDNGGIPPQAVDIAMGFFVMCAVIVIGWPLARAFGRRLERRAETGVAPAMADQLQRIEQAVEAMSIEVERISESQRYMARLQGERVPQVADRT